MERGGREGGKVCKGGERKWWTWKNKILSKLHSSTQQVDKINTLQNVHTLSAGKQTIITQRGGLLQLSFNANMKMNIYDHGIITTENTNYDCG